MREWDSQDKGLGPDLEERSKPFLAGLSITTNSHFFAVRFCGSLAVQRDFLVKSDDFLLLSMISERFMPFLSLLEATMLACP